MSRKDEVKDAISELATWVADHRGDVSHTAFIKACDDIVHKAAHSGPDAYKLQIPADAFGGGLLTLDYLCGALGLGQRTLAQMATYKVPGSSEMYGPALVNLDY